MEKGMNSGKSESQGKFKGKGKGRGAGAPHNPFTSMVGRILLFGREKGREHRIEGDRILLLEKIDETGSLTAAAKACNLSYKAAWDSVQSMNNLSEKALLRTSTGGRGGGGASLTDEGRRVVKIFREIQREQERVLAKFSEHYDDFDEYVRILRRISMKISARNSLSGTIKDIKRGSVNAVVHIALRGNDTVTSSITIESVDGMGLKPGQPVYAIIKATNVMIGTEEKGGMRLSARNVLPGRVSKIMPGPVMSEVILDLPGGNSISSIITRESAESLSLTEGMNAIAIFKASSVIVGVEG